MLAEVGKMKVWGQPLAPYVLLAARFGTAFFPKPKKKKKKLSRYICKRTSGLQHEPRRPSSCLSQVRSHPSSLAFLVISYWLNCGLVISYWLNGGVCSPRVYFLPTKDLRFFGIVLRFMVLEFCSGILDSSFVVLFLNWNSMIILIIPFRQLNLFSVLWKSEDRRKKKGKRKRKEHFGLNPLCLSSWVINLTIDIYHFLMNSI